MHPAAGEKLAVKQEHQLIHTIKHRGSYVLADTYTLSLQQF